MSVPTDFTGLAAWYRYRYGVVASTANLVSRWNDQSGNTRDLVQATTTNQPTLMPDGSILFDGVDNFMATGAFTLNQPVSIYIYFKHITWTDQDRIFDGESAANACAMIQNTSSPLIAILADTTLASVSLALDTYGVISTVFNGVNSVLQLNNGTPVTGNTGAINPGGFTLASQDTGGVQHAHIQVKEVLIYSVAHDAPTRMALYEYLIRTDSGDNTFRGRRHRR